MTVDVRSVREMAEPIGIAMGPVRAVQAEQDRVTGRLFVAEDDREVLVERTEYPDVDVKPLAPSHRDRAHDWDRPATARGRSARAESTRTGESPATHGAIGEECTGMHPADLSCRTMGPGGDVSASASVDEESVATSRTLESARESGVALSVAESTGPEESATSLTALSAPTPEVSPRTAESAVSSAGASTTSIAGVLSAQPDVR